MDPRSILLVFALSCQVFGDDPPAEVAVQCNLDDKLELIYNKTEEALSGSDAEADWQPLIFETWNTVDTCVTPDYLSWRTISNGIAAARNIIVLYIRDLRYNFEKTRADAFVESIHNHIVGLLEMVKTRTLAKFDDINNTLNEVEVKVRAMDFKEVITTLFQGIREYFSGHSMGFGFLLNPITNLLIVVLMNTFLASGELI